jgi:flagellar hook-associated protein 3 FlgL
VDFTAPAHESFTVTVGGRTERLVLDGPVNNLNDLVSNLSSTTNGNAARLANLGISVDTQGFRMPLGVNMTIANGSANIDTVFGLNTSAGSRSTNGVQAQAGDRFFIESSEKQGILNTLARFKDVMETYDGSDEAKDALSAVVAATLSNLSNGINSISDVQAKIGARQNAAESSRELHLDIQLHSKKLMADLRDVDMAEAATRLSQQTLILQAAQQSFIRVSQLNLFDRL